jgi:hypothetical protein
MSTMPALHVGMKTRFAVDFARVFGCFHIDLPSSQILKRLQASDPLRVRLH